MKNSRYIILVFLFACTLQNATAKLKKSSPDSEKSTKAAPAIVAIQIVDPNENSTNSKNSKRTIDAALGYGYNNNHHNQAKYVTYKYSTHDIPAQKGSNRIYSSKIRSKVRGQTSHPKIEVTKSVEYKLPTVTEYIPPTAPANTVGSKIEPGTTLFSTINANGQLGDLSSQVPQNTVEYNNEPVPVIILRIYPQQLNDPQLFANLPQSNPYSSSINNVNLQALLVQYLKALQRQTPQYQAPQQSYYTQTAKPYIQHSYRSHSTQKPQVYYQQTEAPVQYHQQQQQQPETYQYYSQYPSQTEYQPSPQQQTYEQQYYQQPQNVEPQYQQQQYYTQPQNDQIQHQQQQQYLPQNYVYQQQQYQQQAVEYDKASELLTHENYPSDQHTKVIYQQQAVGYDKASELLTHENYPSDKHTQVVFKTKKGKIKYTQTEEPPTKEVKTIKIEVPENIAKIEVQESERPFLPTPPPAEIQSYQYQQDNQQVYYQNIPKEYLNQQYYSAEHQTTSSSVEHSPTESYEPQKVYKTRNAKPHPEIITNSDRGHVFNHHQQESDLAKQQIVPEQTESQSGYYYYQPEVNSVKLESENYYSNAPSSNLNQGEYYTPSSTTLRSPIVAADEHQHSLEGDQIGYSSTISYNVVKRGRTKKRRVKITTSS